MENKLIFPKIEKDKDFKSYLCYYSSLYQPIEINKQIKEDHYKEQNKDPIFKLLESEKIQNFYHQPNFLKFFYFNKETIHSILYEKDEVIYIDSIKNDNLFFISHLYLSLLIEDNTNVINYSYPFELIKNINEIQTKTEKKDNIKKLIISKMIMTLIMNYEQNDSNDINDIFLFII